MDAPTQANGEKTCNHKRLPVHGNVNRQEVCAGQKTVTSVLQRKSGQRRQVSFRLRASVRARSDAGMQVERPNKRQRATNRHQSQSWAHGDEQQPRHQNAIKPQRALSSRRPRMKTMQPKAATASAQSRLTPALTGRRRLTWNTETAWPAAPVERIVMPFLE